jgi:hypothetical protein
MNRFFILLAAAALAVPTLANADLPTDVARAVAAMGHVNDAQKTRLIYSVGTSEHQLTDMLGPWLAQRATSVRSASN